MVKLFFSQAPKHVLAVLMITDVTINAANVVGRYAFGSPIFWAEEAMVYLTVWGIFFGLVAVTFDHQHICMDLFSSRLSPRARLAMDRVVALALFVTCTYIAAQSWQIVRLFWETGAVSSSASIPKVIPHTALLVGFGLAGLAAVARLIAPPTVQLQSASLAEVSLP
ncbi:MAG: TRAP transporter small permease [Burkholderiaceae bacterium]|nr:TRAP transporter small permease [Burkholderiaceae bacterium]